MRKAKYLLTCCGFLAFSTPAFAQDVDHVGRAEEGAAAPALDDIIVTAQKGNQSLQKSPVAITAIGGESLTAQGVVDIRGVQALVPSVRFQQQNAATQIYIRGVGATADFPQVDPPTAFHFNGIYIPREGTSVPIYDVAQLEVLPGPQGTLYGRSALGGIIDIRFKRPTFKQETDVLTEVGNYSMFHTTFVQNVPVTDELAIRGAFDYNRHSGYMTSGANAADDWGARLSLLYEPREDFTAYVFASFVDKNGTASNLVAQGVNLDGSLSSGAFIQKNPWNDQLPPSLLAVSPFGQPDAGDIRYSNSMVGGELKWDISDNLTLTYIPSWLHLEVGVDFWLSGLPGSKRDEYNQTTHELRLSGDHDWGKWLVGLYGYRMRAEGEFFVGAPFDVITTQGFPTSLVGRSVIKGLAGFGQLTYNITDDLRAIFGGRYSVDNRTGGGLFFDGAGLSPYSSDETYRNFDYKVGLNYDLTQQVMLYATLETGYQPGTFNNFASTPALSNQVKASDLTAYTAGVKTRLFGNAVTWNNEFFYYDYKDLLASAFDTVRNATQTFNAKKVEIYGLQSDLVADLSANDRFNITIGYLHARNKDFDRPANLPGGTASFNGLQLQYAPDWTVSAGYYHDFQMPDGYFRAHVTTRYESSFFGDFSQAPGGRQDSYTKTNFSFTYYANDGSWSLGAWVKNIEDEPVQAATAVGSNFPFNPQGASVYLEPPRTYGLRATLNL
ncbi:TonB-dependent receptor [Sphingopyxis granuli]|uniref:TonB-dependent receptor-like protein n=2 Tax=Sphingopyxis TaxID=165697 RepID=D9PTM7_SPHMC|nr:TonB-dependent receptor [Sphingopyxis granuli]ADK93987.1 TonB-dependent receptor-like protein [Sphingopyxis macrogoltabida]AMG75137.1 TonB-dependent receptor-like protein [Sphingopyxis granuli]